MKRVQGIAQNLRKLAKKVQPDKPDLLVRRLQKDYLAALGTPEAQKLLEKEFGTGAGCKPIELDQE